ncbi:MAG: thiol protease/hemagglutinin PrtT [Bacteroidales bacterium]|nr:thiol protease/hemagglutinin PrtT [Bacteroidales bacterium]
MVNKITKKLFLTIICCCTVLTMLAGPVDSAKARVAAQNFWQRQGRATSAMVDITSQVPFSNLYIFNMAEGGFVIISADDCARPVLGYSTQESFLSEEMPPALRYWLGFFDRQIAWARASKVTSPITEHAWKSLLNNAPSEAKYADTVAPLVTTTWSQRPWYNEMCPVDSTLYTYHPTTGCTATGMAQVMKFWNHPRHGYSHYSYSWEGVQPHWTYGTLSADFENTEYLWASMPNALDWGSTQEQINAVALLMSHVGISIQMSYNLYGDSGSDAPIALLEFTDSMYLDHEYCPENALPKFFGYKASLQGIARENISDSIWDNMLREDISNGRPVLYGGFGIDPTTGETNGGHCFILDGYDNNGLFHVNWGWGGSHDAYFPTTALDVSGYSFSDRQEALFGIEPDYSYLEMGADLQVAPTICFAAGSGYFTYNYTVTNKGDSTFNGVIGLGVYDDNQELIGCLHSENVTLEAGASHVVIDGLTELPLLITPGHTYTFVVMYGDDNLQYSVNTTDFVNFFKWIYPASGISTHEISQPVVYAHGHEVFIKQDKAAPVTIFDALGRTIYEQKNCSTTTVHISTSGLYMVHVGDTTTKIIIP